MACQEAHNKFAKVGYPEFGQFISGGYYLVKPEERPDLFSALLPQILVSVSPCIADVGPGCLWESDWGRLTLEQQKADAGYRGDRFHSIDAIVERTALPEGLETASEPTHVMPYIPA